MPNDQSAEGTRITPRDQGKEFSRPAGALHCFVLKRFEAHVLDVEDIHFHLDSAVLLPDFSADDPDADPTDATASPAQGRSAQLICMPKRTRSKSC